MHREILNNPDGILIDHIDQNGLNCQKGNLRLSDKSRNAQNSRTRGKIQYRGVCEHRNKFMMQIRINGKSYKRVSETAKGAALIYNEYALRLYGNSARLNIIS